MFDIIQYLENENIFRKEYVFIKLIDKKLKSYFIKNWRESYFVDDYKCDGIILDDMRDRFENHINKWILHVNLNKDLEYIKLKSEEGKYDIKWYGRKKNNGLFMIFEKNI